jgi:hypothetical protein
VRGVGGAGGILSGSARGGGGARQVLDSLLRIDAGLLTVDGAPRTRTLKWTRKALLGSFVPPRPRVRAAARADRRRPERRGFGHGGATAGVFADGGGGQDPNDA